jgi:hypothetical protein
LSYLCQLATVPGKFDPQKAAQLGVPKGPVSHHTVSIHQQPAQSCHTSGQCLMVIASCCSTHRMSQLVVKLWRAELSPAVHVVVHGWESNVMP